MTSNLNRGPTRARPSVPFEERICTYDELRAMLDTARDRASSTRLQRATRYRRRRDVLVIEALAGAGLRASELAALRCDDVRVPRTREPWLRVVGGKKRSANTSDRVPLTPALAESLALWRSDFTTCYSFTDPLFRRGVDDERALSYQHVWRIVKDAARRAGLRPELSPHSLRHYFVTELARTTRDPLALAAVARLRDPRTALRYIHVAAGELADAVAGVRIPGRRRPSGSREGA